jgi:hypothetical protein
MVVGTPLLISFSSGVSGEGNLVTSNLGALGNGYLSAIKRERVVGDLHLIDSTWGVGEYRLLFI